MIFVAAFLRVQQAKFEKMLIGVLLINCCSAGSGACISDDEPVEAQSVAASIP